MSTWLFIILFSTSDAQVITTNSREACLNLQENVVTEAAKIKLKISVGCFKNLGGYTKES